MTHKERYKKAQAITLKGMLFNIILIVLKIFAGVIGKSAAMIADALHSISDIITDIVVMLGSFLGAKPKDTNHHYGHGKIETLSTAVVALVLFGAATYIFYSGALSIYNHFYGQPVERPEMIALYVAAVSIIGKEILYRYTFSIGKQINSKIIIANAWHHRSDALTSIGVFAGLCGAIFLGEKWRVLDPIAAIIVSLFILKLAFSILKDSTNELIETALPQKLEKEILAIAADVSGVRNPHNLKTRSLGNNIAIDLHIYVEKNLNITQAHDISRSLEKTLQEHYGRETIISIHIEPDINTGL